MCSSSLPTRRAGKLAMNKFSLVFKTQLLSALCSGKNAARRGKAAKAASLTGYIFLWILIAALAAVYEFIYAAAFAESGMIEAFPLLIVLAASLLTLVSSVSYTRSLIFCSKDHDMLFALPIKGSVIVAAKIATLYVLDLAITLALLLPCGVIYGLFASPSAVFYVLYFSLVLFVPMIPILIAALISALVSLIASRFKRAKIIGTVIYVAIFLAFMFGVMRLSMGNAADEEISGAVGGMMESMKTFYPPLDWFGRGISGDILMYLLFIGVSVVVFAAIAAVFGKFYGKIHGLFSARSFRSKYKVSAGALVKKDITRLFSSPGLMLNQISGLIMLVIFTVIFSMNGNPVPVEGEEAIPNFLAAMYPYLLALCASMSSLTSASISLEGKTIGLLKSLPVSARTLFSCKLRVHEIVCFPVIVICGIVLALLSKLTVVDAVILAAIPLLYSYNAGVMGLLLNLKKYNFDWTNEVMVAKNSMPVAVTTFVGVFSSLVPGIVAVVLAALGLDTVIFGGVMIALSLAAAVGLTILLRKKGEKLFREIG